MPSPKTPESVVRAARYEMPMMLAIIGGTGQYRDARGQMLLHARSDGYDFVFSIDR